MLVYKEVIRPLIHVGRRIIVTAEKCRCGVIRAVAKRDRVGVISKAVELIFEFGTLIHDVGNIAADHTVEHDHNNIFTGPGHGDCYFFGGVAVGVVMSGGHGKAHEDIQTRDGNDACKSDANDELFVFFQPDEQQRNDCEYGYVCKDIQYDVLDLETHVVFIDELL